MRYQELPSQQVTAQISRNGSEKDANSQAIQEEVDKVGQGILYSIAAKALGNDYTISSQPGEVSGLIGHTKSKLIAVMGKPTSEDAISVDLSVVSYVTSRTTKTGQPLTCSLNYEISRTGERVLNRKTRCE